MASLDNCTPIVEKYAKHNLNAFFSFYQTSSWSKMTYISSVNSSVQVKNLVGQGMFMETFYIFYWFENVVIYWDSELIDQIQRFIDRYRSTTTYLCTFEVFLCLVAICTLLFYV